MNAYDYRNMVDGMIDHTPLYVYRSWDGIELHRRLGSRWVGTFRTWREVWIYLDGFISGGMR